MEPELENLRRRVAELERALIGIAAPRRRPAIWPAVAGAMGVALVLAAAGARVFAQPDLPSPSKVTAPFEVVDPRGRTLFRVQMSASGAGLGLFFDDAGQEAAIVGKASGADKAAFQVVRKGVTVAGLGAFEGGGGGLALYSATGVPTADFGASSAGDAGLIRVMADGTRRVEIGTQDQSEAGSLLLYNAAGVPTAEFGASSAGDAGLIRVMSDGTRRVEIGIQNQSDAGSLSLYGASQAETILVGDAGVRQKNAQGMPAAQFGVDDNGNGYVMAANRGGTFLSKLGVASNGSSGRVEISGGGEVKVLMGMLDNGKGDLCATGSPGKQVCLSGLAAKTLTPY